MSNELFALAKMPLAFPSEDESDITQDELVETISNTAGHGSRAV
jgi:hypothetical protein